MSEKTVATRIKMARKMAGLETQAALLKKIPQWSASRLGNYEASISMPGPDDILLIAKATQSSPCWLMFGLGPIRPNARDLQAIRHQNLCHTYTEHSSHKNGVPALAAALQIEEEVLAEFIDNPFQQINDELSARYEQYLQLPAGWMDEQHIEHDPLCQSFPDDIRELMLLFSGLDKKNRIVALETMKTLAANLN